MTEPRNLDLANFSNAISRLREALVLYGQDPSRIIIRDGLIQRFEFTNEIAHKMLKRTLEQISASPDEFEGMSFPTLIRSGNEYGLLLGDWPRWRHFRDMRARTSHSYDEAIALAVVADIEGFVAEAAFLRDRIAERTQ